MYSDYRRIDSYCTVVMDLRIYAGDLLVHEVKYEVAIRQREPKVTAELCRAQLTCLMKKNALIVDRSPYSFETEISEIKESLKALKRLSEHEKNFNPLEKRRFNSRRLHIQGRFERLHTSSADQEIIKEDLEIEFLALTEHFEDRVDVEKNELVQSSSGSNESDSILGSDLIQFSDVSCSEASHGYLKDSVPPYCDLTSTFRTLSVINPSDCTPLVQNDRTDTSWVSQPQEMLPLDQVESTNPFNASFNPFLASTPVQRIVTERSFPSVPVHKWGLQFSGSQGGQSVVDFLNRVHELRKARNVSFEQLFDSAVDLFKEPALSWFRSNRNSLCSWNDLELSLKQTFIPPNYDEALLDEIKSRRQFDGETLNTFVNVMRMKFGKLIQPIPEAQQINIIRRNFLKSVNQQLILLEIPTYAELEKYCRLIVKNSPSNCRLESRPKNKNQGPNEIYSYADGDKLKSKESDQFRELPLGSDLNKGSFSERPVGRSNQLQSLERLSNKPFPRSKIICWNCNSFGHLGVNCGKKRTLYCYSCGRKNVSKKSCPVCTPTNAQNSNSENLAQDSQEGATALTFQSRPQKVNPSQGAYPKSSALNKP